MDMAFAAALVLSVLTPLDAAIAAPVAPPPLAGAAMAYDAARHQIVLFGGGTDQGLSDETWTWQAGRWTQQHPTASPPARAGAGIAYDAALKTVVLFGGWGNGPNPFEDTWLWDGKNWRRGALGPTGRCSPAMAYDAANQQIVMFGGDCVWGMDDTWTWSNGWTQRFPRSSPPILSGAGMAYDAAHEQIVLFGGVGSDGDGGSRRRHGTWTWDGTTWTKYHTALSPSSRSDMGMAYDGQQVVLFGGFDFGGPTDQTWTWDGVRWMRQFPAQSPSARYSPAMAYDAAAGKIVLFGGFNGTQVFGDTWRWDGSTWHTR
jgi:hypothetical protein